MSQNGQPIMNPIILDLGKFNLKNEFIKAISAKPLFVKYFILFAKIITNNIISITNKNNPQIAHEPIIRIHISRH